MVCFECKGTGFVKESTGDNEIETLQCSECSEDTCDQCNESYSVLLGHCVDCYSLCTSCKSLILEEKMHDEDYCILCADEAQ